MGKSKASRHSSTGGTGRNAAPVFGFDYAFMNDREGSKLGNEKEDKGDDEGDSVIKVLVGHDSRSRACTATPVPQKGVHPNKYAVRETLKYLDVRGYQSLG